VTTRQVEIVFLGRDHGASSVANSVVGSLRRIGEIATGILTAGIFTRLAAAVKRFAEEGIGLALWWEKLAFSLNTLVERELRATGALDAFTLAATGESTAMAVVERRAQELYDWITKLSVISPFDPKSIANTLKVGLAYGFTTVEAQRVTEAVVKFGTAVGLTSEDLDRIGLALGQVHSKGKLTGEEIRQLANAFLPVREIMTDALGITLAEFDKLIRGGLIPADKALEILISTMETDFAGVLEKFIRTTPGLVQAFKSLSQIGLRDFFTAVVDAANPFLAELILPLIADLPAFEARVKAAGQAVGVWLTDKLTWLRDNIPGIKAAITDFFTALKVGDVPKILDMLGVDPAMKAAILGFVDDVKLAWIKFQIFWTTNGPAIEEALGRIGKALFGMVEGEQISLLERLGLALSGFGTWLIVNGPALAGAIEQVATWVETTLAPALSSISQWVMEHGDEVLLFLVGFVGTLKVVALIGAIGAAVAGFVAAINPVVLLAAAIGGLFVAIYTLGPTALEAAKKLPLIFMSVLLSASTAAQQLIVIVVGGFYLLVQRAILGWQMLVAAILTKLGQITLAIATWIAALLTNMALAATKWVKIGTDWVQGLWNGIKGKWVEFKAWLKGILQEAIDLANQIFGVHSPSRAFEKIGENLVAGFEKGAAGLGRVPSLALAGTTSDMRRFRGSGDSTYDQRRSLSVMEMNINGAQDPAAVRDEILKFFEGR